MQSKLGIAVIVSLAQVVGACVKFIQSHCTSTNQVYVAVLLALEAPYKTHATRTHTEAQEHVTGFIDIGL